jgi:outer membrane protein TolC/Spy/CpxP family protein refolding chaperone
MMFSTAGRPVLVLLVVLLAQAVSAAALEASDQTQPPSWWRSDEFRTALSLTPDQVAQIDSIFQATLPELRQDMDELDRLEARLSRLIENDAEETVIARHIDRVETARANVNKTRSLMLVRMRRVLTPEQRARMRTLEEEARKRGVDPRRRSGPDSGRTRGFRMSRTVWTSAGTVVLSLATLTIAPAHAQTSEARIQELIRQAADATSLTAPAQATVQGQNATEVVALTLDAAVELALERNLDIAVQRLNPQLQDIAIATARAFYNPTLTSTFSQTENSSAPTNQLQVSQGGGGVVSSTLTYNGGLVQNLPWGGSIQATLNNSRQATTSNNAFYNPSFQSIWSVNFAQPMLRGFRIDAQRRQLQISRTNRDISDVQLRASVTNIISNVRNAYWDYVFATQAVEVAQQSLDLATKLVQDNQVRVEVGTMAPIDVVQAQAEQATRRQGLVTAESNRRTAELALKRLVVSGTADPNWNATINPTDRPEFRAEPVDVEAAIRRALGERTDLEIARKNVQSNTLTMSYLRNETLPAVNLQVNYGVQGIGGPFQVRSNTGVLGSTVTETIPGGLGDALSSLFRNRYPRWTVGVNVLYPLGLSSQQTAVARARVQLSQVEAQLKQIELQIATDVTNASIQLRNASEAVQASQAARELSQRRLEAEQSKFEVGMSTNYFVVQAQRDLNDARNSELRAVLNHRKALVEFERLQQTALQSQNITILQ